MTGRKTPISLTMNQNLLDLVDELRLETGLSRPDFFSWALLCLTDNLAASHPNFHEIDDKIKRNLVHVREGNYEKVDSLRVFFARKR